MILKVNLGTQVEKKKLKKGNIIIKDKNKLYETNNKTW